MKSKLSKDLILSETEMDFNEASELFSDETINNLQMLKVIGGEISPYGIFDICPNVCTDVCPNLNCPCDPVTNSPTNVIGFGCHISVPPFPNPYCAAQDNCIPITLPPSPF